MNQQPPSSPQDNNHPGQQPAGSYQPGQQPAGSYQPGQQPAGSYQPGQYPGQQYAGSPHMYAAPPPFNTMAIVAMVMVFVISPVAAILGHIALKQIKERGERGRELAIVATVLGWLGVAVTIAWIFMLVAATNQLPI